MSQFAPSKSIRFILKIIRFHCYIYFFRRYSYGKNVKGKFELTAYTKRYYYGNNKEQVNLSVKKSRNVSEFISKYSASFHNYYILFLNEKRAKVVLTFKLF
jgi:hypothetical protein